MAVRRPATGSRRRPARRKPGRRTRRPAVWLWGLYLVAAWLVISWGRAAVLPRLIEIDLAGEQLFELSEQHRALVIRREQVLTTPVSGTFIPLVADGELVRAGAVIGRVTNEQEEVRLAAELEQVEAELVRATASLAAFEDRSDDLLAALRQDHAVVAAQLNRALAWRRSAEVLELERELQSLADDIGAVYRRLTDERRAVEQLENRRDGIIVSRKQLTTPVEAPVAGAVVHQVDGLETVVTIDWLADQDPERILRLEPAPVSILDGQQVAAGDAVARLVDVFDLWLAVAVPVSRIDRMTRGRIDLRVGDLELTGLVMGTSGPVRGDRQLLSIAIDRVAPPLLRERFVDVDVIWVREYGVVVPSSAVAERDGESGVYTVSRTVVRFTPVDVLAVSGGQCLVDGVRAGDRIVLNPRLVWDGMTLP